MRKWLALLIITLSSCVTLPAWAASLQVAPVRIEVNAQAAVAKLTLENPGPATLNAQVRVFKWESVNGRERLVPTRDVVASPPFVRLKPGRRNIVRVVRTSKAPRAPEESYRLLVDELPNARRRPGVAVNFVLRQSIPVFFTGPDRRPHAVTWSVRRSKAGVQIVATNGGDKRLRVSALKIVDSAGKIVAARKGLVGYVLGGSKAVWTLKTARGHVRSGSRVRIIAQGDDGPIGATAQIQPGG